MAKKTEKEIVEEMGILDQVITIETPRNDGRGPRIQFDYQNCPSRTDQSAAHLTDINYLMKKYSPDELTMYLATRNSQRQEILGHDFSTEPSMQDGLNLIADVRRVMEKMPKEIKAYASTPLEFVKFLDNPQNQEILIRHKILGKKEIAEITQAVTPTTKEEKATTPATQQSS